MTILKKIKNKLKGFKAILNFDNSIELLTARMWNRNNLLIYKLGELQFVTDHLAGDENGARDLLVTKMYSKYLKIISKNSQINFIDIGANNGGFPLLLKHLGFKVTKGISIEMNPNTFSRLSFNLHRNFVNKQCSSINAAICNNNGIISGLFNNGSTGESISSMIKSKETTHNFDIPTKTLNNLIKQEFGDNKIDICKIDIEGAEFDVFNGNNCDRIRQCRYIIMELHRSRDENFHLIAKLQTWKFKLLSYIKGVAFLQQY